jgi:hypothetical protein
MRLRFAKVPQDHLEKCAELGLWGSNLARFAQWNKGDFLAFKVDNRIAALATVSGESYCAGDEVWDSGIYPFRIPIRFERIIPISNRPKFSEIQSELKQIWGPSYGWGIMTQVLVKGPPAEKIIKFIRSFEGGPVSNSKSLKDR